MIDTNNFKELIITLGFTEIRHNYYCFDSYSMAVDFDSERLIYPNSLKQGHKNSSFTQKENFVVFECVFRLLQKGYRIEDLELEKQWNLGHTAKGGRADIIVYKSENTSDEKQNKSKVLFIIECKKFGDEYKKEFKNTLNDGGQLFSYLQQERSCEWLVLYASDYVDGNIIYKTNTIKCTDDPNIVLLANHDDNISLFKDAHSNVELFNIWNETYDKQILDDVVFSEDTVAYQIGIKPLRKKDLIDFSEKNGIVNSFEEILRHNNVSDKENAFNRLIALFIAKLVDEITKTDDDELDFQYKFGVDTYEKLQDRLQRLHKDGMEKFMKEKIIYISDEYPKKLIQGYTGHNREKIIEDLENTIKLLKFYTNNDFAFKDVHNEELFYQNGKILVEVVQLFQPYKIIGSNNLQLLGDLFEQLLNKGFKQNEGQFFTPTPITRFIWNSLPLENILFKDGKFQYPKVIDYACGAGHFLTEGIEAIRDILKEHNIAESDKWHIENIYGIEKDYRLARVSKISMFMHGAGDSNIIFGDGLENYPDKGIDNNQFDILVANPPYSVKGFKPHLVLKNNSIDVLDYVSNEGSEIETCFVERIAQLLKPNGICAVILPSPILNKTNNSFIKARESILENFKIKAIVQLGSQTFGATGTSTVILFLMKFDEPPKKIDLASDSVSAIIEKRDLNDWKDNELFESYLKTINVAKDEYIEFISGKVKDSSELCEYFYQYISDFKSTIEKKKIDKENAKKKFYEYVMKIEKEKLRIFSLAYEQKTLVIKAPENNKEQKAFLGYEWSNAKGSEGLKLLSNGYLLDLANRKAKDKFAYIVNHIFSGDFCKLPNEFSHFYTETKDLIDFNSPDFIKIIKLADPFKGVIVSKYNSESLGSISPYVTERIDVNSFDMRNYVSTENMLQNKLGIIKYEEIPQISSAIEYKANDILVSNIRPYLRKIWLADCSGGASPDVLVFRNKSNLVNTKYLYIILHQNEFFDYMMENKQGSKMPRGNKTAIEKFAVPIPPMDIQKRIIKDFEDLNKQIGEIDLRIDKLTKSISNKFTFLSNNKWDNELIDNLFTLQIGKTPSRNKTDLWNSNDYKWISVADMANYNIYTENTSEFISDEAIKETGIKIIPKNTVIMSFKLTIGRTAITSEPIYSNEAIVAFLPLTERILNLYLMFLLRTLDWSDNSMNAVKGNTLNKDKIKKKSISVPPLSVQQEFVDFVTITNQEIDYLKDEIRKLESEKDNLLRKYFD